MPLEHLANNPEVVRITTEQALNAAWTKNGQLLFEIDILKQQLIAFEQECNKLKAEIADLKGSKKGK